MAIINVPSGIVHINSDTNSAIEGTYGTPSDVNRFVTDSDSRNSNARVAYAFHGASEIINISNANPAAGQVIIASSPSTASWASLPVIHAISTSAPTQLIAGAGSSVGTGDTVARADHAHATPVAGPVSIGFTNSIGSSQSLSRADHVHAHGAQSDGTLHALATTVSHGFLSNSDKADILKWFSPGSGCFIGAEHSSSAIELTLGTSFVTYHAYTTQVSDPGTYRYGWSFKIKSEAIATYATIRILVDGILIHEELVTTPAPITTPVFCGFAYVNSSTSMAHTITVSMKKTGNKTITCRGCNLEFWRKY